MDWPLFLNKPNDEVPVKNISHPAYSHQFL